MRFREHADIKQMYRQILIDPQHTSYQKILWRFSPDTPIEQYVLNTVTYGVSSAAFLAIRTLLQLAEDEQKPFPHAAQVLRTDVYMDDIVTRCSSINVAISLQVELQTLLKEGGFELRKWSSNNSTVLNLIPPALR